MATIKEIAALAGVSRGTVDRVLNDRGAVNPETAEKIRKIAKELDYKPNRAGLVLAAQKKRLKLGVILFSTGNPFFQDVLTGINEKAEELAGYNCTVITKQISFGVEAQLQAVKELLAEEVNGIAMTPYNDERIRDCINTLYGQGIPVVTLNTDIENSRRIAYVGKRIPRPHPPRRGSPRRRSSAIDDLRHGKRGYCHRFLQHSLSHRAHCGISEDIRTFL